MLTILILSTERNFLGDIQRRNNFVLGNIVPYYGMKLKTMGRRLKIFGTKPNPICNPPDFVDRVEKLLFFKDSLLSQNAYFFIFSGCLGALPIKAITSKVGVFRCEHYTSCNELTYEDNSNSDPE